MREENITIDNIHVATSDMHGLRSNLGRVLLIVRHGRKLHASRKRQGKLTDNLEHMRRKVKRKREDRYSRITSIKDELEVVTEARHEGN